MLIRICTVIALLFTAGSLHAQAYPSKSVRIVAPFPAGGGLDITARAFGQKFGDYWGQTVVIENRPGASGMIGAESVARSPKDGYVILLCSPAEIALNPALYAKMNYDPFKDLAPVSLAATYPNMIVVHASVPAKSIKELIALSKKTEGGLPFGSSGTGSTQHLAGEWLKANAGINYLHVPYKGAAPAVTDLVGGQIPTAILGLAPIIPHVKSGRIRGLAVTSAKRSAAAPDIPTLHEAGIDFESTQWFGFLVPAGTPADVIAKIQADTKRAAADAGVKERLISLGGDPFSDTPEEFAAFIKAENAKYAKVIRDAHIKADESARFAPHRVTPPPFRTMLSANFVRLKKLRSAGNFPDACTLLAGAKPESDEDAFEAVVCLYCAGEFDALLKFGSGHRWQNQWPLKACQAVTGIVMRQDPRAALALAREAVRAAGANPDAVAVYLILLQMNGLIDEAAAYVRDRLPNPPADEILLSTVLGEIAATTGDWTRAYAMATLVLSTNPHNTRALVICSMASYESGNVHEALGNAIHANKVKPREQPTALQLMKCYNKLADFYSTLAAFNDIKDQGSLLPEIHAQLGFAQARLGNLDAAVKSYRESLKSGRVSLTAIRGLLKIFINSAAARDLETLIAQYREDIFNDIESLTTLARDRLHRRDLAGAHELLRRNLTLSIEQGVGYNSLSWPVPEPRLRHDLEQLELLESRSKLTPGGVRALPVLKRYAGQNSDLGGKFAPPGHDGEMLRQALAEYHYCPDPPFSGTTLGGNDYSAIEDSFMQSAPKLAVIDNFLSPAALASLREYCEEATIWKSYFDNGYVGTLFGSGFCPRVLLAIADEMKMMMPRVIGGAPLTQAWAFKYDQRLRGINMHADFANVNVNFWITPDDACVDKTTGGMVIYDVPAPSEWTFEDYNGKSGKMAAFLEANNARPRRVPYRENRCVIFDSTLFHTTDEIHFKPGYCNRRVNVTLLYGKSLNAD